MTNIIGWSSVVVYAVGNVALARHKLSGWILRIFGSLGFIYVGLEAHTSSIVGLEVLAIGTALYGIKNWRKQ